VVAFSLGGLALLKFVNDLWIERERLLGHTVRKG
jgi:hypothetical protein